MELDTHQGLIMIKTRELESERKKIDDDRREEHQKMRQLEIDRQKLDDDSREAVQTVRVGESVKEEDEQQQGC